MKNSLDTAKKIGSYVYQTKESFIDKEELEKKQATNNYLSLENEKLLNLKYLKKKIEKEEKMKHISNSENIHGLIISKDITSNEKELWNNYSFKLIY